MKRVQQWWSDPSNAAMERVNQKVKQDLYPVALEASGSQMDATQAIHWIQFASAMTAAEIHAKISRNCDPRAYTPKAGQAPATVLCNTNYFGIFRKMSTTYHEAKMIGRIFFANQPTVRSFLDTVICLVSTSLWESFEQKEPQPSVSRYRHSRCV